MKHIGLPPGNILQNIYINKRLKELKKEGLKSFIEIGSGNGYNSELLLENGYSGIGFDLNKSACENNSKRNKEYIKSGHYSVQNGDFFDSKFEKKFDIIISCMVIEHMPDDLVLKYFKKAKELLSDNGRIICLVPSSMKHWGVEDDIAGHIKRYELNDVIEIEKSHKLSLVNQVGLTYPISNLLLGMSNRVINNKEKDMLDKTQQEKTVYTGNREVKYKTEFPKFFNFVLNSWAMYPLHILQMMFKKNKNAMVMYFELKK